MTRRHFLLLTILLAGLLLRLAAMAVQPWTPNAWKARRSAWMPALPPLSLPAIVSATGCPLDKVLRLADMSS